MPQAYSDPKRENEATALPNIEYWHASRGDILNDEMYADTLAELVTENDSDRTTEANNLAGWYWWSCFPGCLPDSDPIGPFATEAECIADFQDGAE